MSLESVATNRVRQPWLWIFTGCRTPTHPERPLENDVALAPRFRVLMHSQIKRNWIDWIDWNNLVDY